MDSQTAVGAKLDESPPDPPSERARSRLTQNQAAAIALTVITALTAGFYLFYELKRYGSFQDSTDLVYFDQAVRSYAHFHAGISPLFGRYWGHPAGVSVLGDHFSPIVAALAPLYWIHSAPQTLLVAQAVLYALAIPPIWVFTRRAVGAAGGGSFAAFTAYAVVLVYALSWPVASAVAFNFHESAFAPVLMALVLERLQAGRTRGALLAIGALLLVKEDMGLFGAGIGLYLLATSWRPMISRQRLVALGVIAGGLCYTWIATRVFIPAFGGSSAAYWAFPQFGDSIPQAIFHVIAHPASSLQVLGTPSIKVTTTLWLFGALAFLPLLSPITLAALPLLLERMFGTTRPNWWQIGFHYNSFVEVLLLLAAVDGAIRLDRWARPALRRAGAWGGRAARRGEPGATALAVSCVLAAVTLWLLPRFSFGSAVDPHFYQQRQSATVKAEARIAALIPPGVTVESTSSISPELSAHDTVWIWYATKPLWAKYVIAQVNTQQFTFSSVSAQRQRVALLERNGYQVVYQRLGFVLLRRAG